MERDDGVGRSTPEIRERAVRTVFEGPGICPDRSLYRLRNLVESCFHKLKNTRRIATRDDKTAENFPGFIDITPIPVWLRHLST